MTHEQLLGDLDTISVLVTRPPEYEGSEHAEFREAAFRLGSIWAQLREAPLAGIPGLGRCIREIADSLSYPNFSPREEACRLRDAVYRLGLIRGQLSSSVPIETDPVPPAGVGSDLRKAVNPVDSASA